MLTLNDRVHYGTDTPLMAEFSTAIESNVEKFNAQIDPIANWYWRHAGQGDHPYKLAAETYVSIVGEPQLFIEGNHRTGSLIANWINLHAGYPPFVLTVDNAIDYFAPSAAIKQFCQPIDLARSSAAAEIPQVVSHVLGRAALRAEVRAR